MLFKGKSLTYATKYEIFIEDMPKDILFKVNDVADDNFILEVITLFLQIVCYLCKRIKCVNVFI